MDCQIVPKVHCQNLQLGNYSFQIMQLEYALIATRSEMIITNRLVGYQSTSRRQYYEIG